MEPNDNSRQLPDREALEEFARENLFSIENVAYALGVSTRTVLRYQSQDRDPLPVAIRGGKGKPSFYILREVTDWSVRQEARRRGFQIP